MLPSNAGPNPPRPWLAMGHDRAVGLLENRLGDVGVDRDGATEDVDDDIDHKISAQGGSFADASAFAVEWQLEPTKRPHPADGS